jgi:hypothetical protein
VDYCRKKLILLLSHRIKRIDDSWFKSFFYGDFSNASTRCSVKCLRGHKLFFDLIFAVDFTRILASIVSCFHCVS